MITKRIHVLDSLRGFSLLGVIIIHMIQSFGIQNPSSEITIFNYKILDESANWFAYNIVMGRFINIFALLFGLSFYIQLSNSKNKNQNFRNLFLRRMLFLLFLGLFAHSFYNVEILSVYALFGMILYFLRNLSNSSLLIISIFFLLGGQRIVQTFNHNNSIQENVEINTNYNSNQKHITEPSLLNSVKNNYEQRLIGKISYQFGMYGRGYLTLSIFILGFIIGRLKIFENLGSYKKEYFKLFIYSILAFILISVFINILPESNSRILFFPQNNYISSYTLFIKALEDLLLLLSSIFILIGFIMLYNNQKFKIYLDYLSPYGKSALTNYTLQGVFGAIIFYPWAFGNIFSLWGDFSIIILGILIYFTQMILSKYHLSNFRYGPLEWLWRCFTYLSIQPNNKPK
tara:strand:- start:1060 stop:2265 length:1206 start_codon:yes stop_codon:yes gene_type:complete